jgi:hypothetical protein
MWITVMMVNLSNVTHTYVWGASNEQASSTVASVVGIGTNASIGVEGLLLRCNNYKTTFNKKSI